jgi:hypothetical protein
MPARRNACDGELGRRWARQADGAKLTDLPAATRAVGTALSRPRSGVPAAWPPTLNVTFCD